jgi:hypothetical protein
MSDEKHDRDGSVTASQDQETRIAGRRNVVTPAMTGAERARALRRRRRDKLRVHTIELREEELDAMVKNGLLGVEDSDNQFAIIAALYSVLDRSFSALAAGRLPKVPG